MLNKSYSRRSRFSTQPDLARLELALTDARHGAASQRHPDGAHDKAIANLKQRFAKQGARVNRLTERSTQQMTQLRRTLVELREAGAELRALRWEAQMR